MDTNGYLKTSGHTFNWQRYIRWILVMQSTHDFVSHWRKIPRWTMPSKTPQFADRTSPFISLYTKSFGHCMTRICCHMRVWMSRQLSCEMRRSSWISLQSTTYISLVKSIKTPINSHMHTTRCQRLWQNNTTIYETRWQIYCRTAVPSTTTAITGLYIQVQG